MAPTFLEAREPIAHIVKQGRELESGERQIWRENYFFRWLYEKSREEVDRLYQKHCNGESKANTPAKALAIDNTLKKLATIQANRKETPGIQLRIQDTPNGIIELPKGDELSLERRESGYLRYLPYSIYPHIDTKEVFLALEIFSSDAKEYFALAYNNTLSEVSAEEILEDPSQWEPAYMSLTLAKAYHWHFNNREVDPSLIVCCDISETEFAKDYLEVLGSIEQK